MLLPVSLGESDFVGRSNLGDESIWYERLGKSEMLGFWHYFEGASLSFISPS